MIPFTLALIALGVIFVVGVFLVELENFGWATVALIVTGVAVQYLHVADILTYVSQNILTSVKWVSIYLILGIIWSFVKWGFFLLNFRDKFREVKQKFLTIKQIPNNNTTPVPPELQGEFDNHLRSQYSYGSYGSLQSGKKPVVIENKKRIIAWMSFWPCSIIGFLFNDLVRRIFTFIFNRLNGLYQKLADAIFANDPELK